MKQGKWLHEWKKITACLLLAAAAAYCLLTLLRPGEGLDGILAAMRMATRCVALVGAAVLLLRPQMKPERMFLLLGLLLGLCYVFMLVPLASPDEQAHYRYALTVASQWLNGGLTADANYLDFSGLTPHENSAEALQAFLSGLTQETLTGENVAFAAGHTSYPLMYLPQILAFLLGMVLRLNRFWLYVLGDLFCLGCYLALMSLAIRIIPRGKMPMALCGLVPVALQQAASLSTDGITMGMAWLVIALAVRAMEQERRLTARDMVTLGAACVLLAPAKAVYILLLGLLPMIPASRFSGKKQKWLFVGLVVCLACAATFAFQLAWLQEMAAAEGGEGANYSFGWIFTHPLETVRLVAKSIIPFGIYFYLETGIGSSLAGLTLEVHSGFIWTMILLLLASALFLPREEKPLPGWKRGSFAGIFLLVLLACAATMMVAWTPAGDDLIQGVQGRYLLPAAPLLLMALGSGSFESKRDIALPCRLGFVLMELLVLNDVINHFAGLTF